MSFSVSEGSLKRKTPKIKEFLSGLELDFDDLITYSVIIEEEGQIVATGSIHENVLKCIAVAKEHQGKGYMATVVTYLANEMVRRGISHYFVFTKPENLRIFADLGFYQIICTDDVLFMENTKNGILNYVNLLKEESFCAKGEKIGAIIANCNPFTNGHEYLIETASEKCDVLHLFVLSSENGMFLAKERFEMVQKGVQHLKNVFLHKTSDYLISPATFPTYFIKDKARADDINCALDLEIFNTYIVQTLGINVRFVGQEPYCQVTNAYNQTMRAYFEQKNIEFCEIERKTVGDRAISATYVREKIFAGDFCAIKDFVPQTTLEYLKNR